MPRVRDVQQGADLSELQDWLAANGLRNAYWYRRMWVDKGTITAEVFVTSAPDDLTRPHHVVEEGRLAVETVTATLRSPLLKSLELVTVWPRNRKGEPIPL